MLEHDTRRRLPLSTGVEIALVDPLPEPPTKPQPAMANETARTKPLPADSPAGSSGTANVGCDHVDSGMTQFLRDCLSRDSVGASIRTRSAGNHRRG